MEILITDGTKLQGQINGSSDGDIITFADSVVVNNTVVEFRGNRTYTGQIKFTGFPNNKYGINLENNCSNLTITKMKVSGGGILASKGSLSNIKILKSEFFNIPTIYCIMFYSSSNGTVIEDNFFHDYAGWGAELWGCSNGSYSWNTFKNITQGLHIMNPNKFIANNNVGFGLKRIGLEIQQSNSTQMNVDGLTVTNNVFWDWANPYWDSYGLSIMPQTMTNVNVNNNYCKLSRTGDFSTTDSSGKKRWGIGIEFGAKTGRCNKNIVACNDMSAPAFAVSMKDISVDDNDIYGFNSIVYGTGKIQSEPGLGPPAGTYPVVNQSNNREHQYTEVGEPPDWAKSRLADPLGPRPDGSTPIPPTPIIIAPINLKGVVVSSTQVDLSWEDKSDNETGFSIQRKTTKGGDPWITVGTANAVSYSDKGLNPNWEYDYRILAFNDFSVSSPSNVVTVQLMAVDPIPPEVFCDVPLMVFGQTLIDHKGKSGYGPIGINQSNGEVEPNDGHALTINGKVYPTGLGVHANFSASFPLTGEVGIFQCKVGVDDETKGVGDADFIVLLDTVEVFRQNLKSKQDAIDVAIDVTEKSILTIEADGLDSISDDHIDIIAPEVFRAIFKTKILKPNKFVLTYEDGSEQILIPQN